MTVRWQSNKGTGMVEACSCATATAFLLIGTSPMPEWFNDRSGMNREIHVPLRESLKVRFLWTTPYSKDESVARKQKRN